MKAGKPIDHKLNKMMLDSTATQYGYETNGVDYSFFDMKELYEVLERGPETREFAQILKEQAHFDPTGFQGHLLCYLQKLDPPSEYKRLYKVLFGTEKEDLLELIDDRTFAGVLTWRFERGE